jgi:hypothetical protein
MKVLRFYYARGKKDKLHELLIDNNSEYISEGKTIIQGLEISRLSNAMKNNILSFAPYIEDWTNIRWSIPTKKIIKDSIKVLLT